MSCGCNDNNYEAPSCDGSANCADFPSNQLPKVACGLNTQKGIQKRFAMVEVKTNGASSSSSNPTTPGEASNVNVQCPTNAAPFYSYTTDEVVTLPGVGGLFVIKVCNATLWRNGMWVAHPLGDFPIISIDTVLNTLTLRNSCNDNSAIPNNGSPGDTYNGPAIITPTTSPCDRREEVNEQVQDYLEETSEICNPNIPDLTGAERVNLMGGLAECVDTCSGQTQPGTRCQRFVPGAYGNEQGIQIPNAPERTLGARTFNGLTAPMQLMAVDPVNGQMVRVDIPPDGSYSLNVASGIMTLAPQGASQMFYTTPKSVASGATAANLRDLNAISGVTVPSWATHAILEVRASVYSLGAQGLGNRISNASVYVNGREVAHAGSKEVWDSNVFRMDSSDTDTNTVYAQLNGSSINVGIEQSSPEGRNPRFDSYVKLIGFTKAVIES